MNKKKLLALLQGEEVTSRDLIRKEVPEYGAAVFNWVTCWWEGWEIYRRDLVKALRWREWRFGAIADYGLARDLGLRAYSLRELLEKLPYEWVLVFFAPKGEKASRLLRDWEVVQIFKRNPNL